MLLAGKAEDSTLDCKIHTTGWERKTDGLSNGSCSAFREYCSRKIALWSFCDWWKPTKIYYFLKHYFNKTPNCVYSATVKGIVPDWINLYLCLACQDLKALNKHFFREGNGGRQNAHFGNQPHSAQLKIITENWMHMALVDGYPLWKKELKYYCEA